MKNNNSKFIHKDIKELQDGELLGYYPEETDVKVLIGCAPCQPFLRILTDIKGSSASEGKLDLLDYFGKQIRQVKPEIVSMENVPQLAKEDILIGL